MTDITERLRALYVQTGTDYVQEAADEIDRLRVQGLMWRDERDALRAEVDGLRADAERWRWLRDKITRISISAWPDCDDATDGPSVVREIRVMDRFRVTDPESSDAAIDASRAKND